MPFLRTWVTILALVFIAGCSSRPPTVSEKKAGGPATGPTAAALLPLDQIQPRPRLSELAPATQPATRPSLAALELYAEGRALYLERNATKAVESLRRALEFDKNSPEIN